MPFDDMQLSHGVNSLEEEYADNDLPPIPQTLVLVDIQEEFNHCIHFDCQQFLHWLKKCSDSGTTIHVVYDQLGMDPPAMFDNVANYFYEKAYGADPHEGVVDPDTGENINAADMEYDKLYFDPSARLKIFRSSGHEFQHVWPQMEGLIQNLKGTNPTVVGGSETECLQDMLDWLEMNGIQYNVERRFVF